MSHLSLFCPYFVVVPTKIIKFYSSVITENWFTRPKKKANTTKSNAAKVLPAKPASIRLGKAQQQGAKERKKMMKTSLNHSS